MFLNNILDIKIFRPTKKALLLFLKSMLIVTFTGCNDFLDEVPDNRVSLDDIEKAAQLVTNAYSLASPAFTDWMTDDVGWTTGTNIRLQHQQAFLWEDITTGPTTQDTPDFFWYQTYDAIAHANEVLAVIDDIKTETENERARQRAVKAEALLARAYGHFMLVNLFSQHFNFQTAGSDLGIPYIQKPETVFIGKYERLSVKRTYEKIEDDLIEGLDLVDDSFLSGTTKYHFNKNAALAFASRFYLFKGDLVRCLEYSNLMLGANPSFFVRDLTSPEYQGQRSSILGYPQVYSSADDPSNLLLIRKISLVQRNDFAFGPLSSFYSSLFAAHPFEGAEDQRENPAFVKGDNALFPVRYESLFERSSLNSNTGFPYHIAIAFRGEEVLLNRAEVYILQNKIDLAIADLQVLADKRYVDGNPVFSIELLRAFYGNDSGLTDQLVLLNYILLERRREFISQGMRWFDLKRYGLSITHVLEDEITAITLGSEDLRKALQIPTSAIDVGGLEPNPR